MYNIYINLQILFFQIITMSPNRFSQRISQRMRNNEQRIEQKNCVRFSRRIRDKQICNGNKKSLIFPTITTTLKRKKIKKKKIMPNNNNNNNNNNNSLWLYNSNNAQYCMWLLHPLRMMHFAKNEINVFKRAMICPSDWEYAFKILRKNMFSTINIPTFVE